MHPNAVYEGKDRALGMTRMRGATDCSIFALLMGQRGVGSVFACLKI